MKMKYVIAACTLSALVITLLPAEAGNITERMKRDCKSDYNRYCKKYQLGSDGLRACMSRSIKKVSNRCIGALVAGGEMTQAQADGLAAKKKRSAKR
jgi:hypothetical protein